MSEAMAAKRPRKTPQKPQSKRTRTPARARGKTGTIYTEELGDQLCDLLASGYTLRRACRELGTVSEATVRGWSLNSTHPFSPKYALAREVGYRAMGDEIIDIADDRAKDWIEKQGKGGKTFKAPDETAISRARLQCEMRRWLLSKALPKVFGDKLELAGPDGGAIQVQHNITMTKFERARRMALIVLEGQAGKAQLETALGQIATHYKQEGEPT